MSADAGTVAANTGTARHPNDAAGICHLAAVRIVPLLLRHRRLSRLAVGGAGLDGRLYPIALP